jgi:hypothetical protein
MPTRFAQQFKRTAVRNLVRQFGETIGYSHAGASERLIQAIVVRDPTAILAEIGEVVVNAMIVRVVNDSATGIAATDLDTGRDYVSVALVADGEPERRSIIQVLSDTNGFVRFLVQ